MRGISLKKRRIKLKFSRIRVSSRSTHAFGMLKSSTGLTPNILARFCICLSIKQRGIPNPDEYNKDGAELAPAVLFGEHEPVYLALVINRLKQDGLDPEHYLDEMTRAHLNRGAIGLRQRIDGLSDFYDLIKEEGHV